MNSSFLWCNGFNPCLVTLTPVCAGIERVGGVGGERQTEKPFVFFFIFVYDSASLFVLDKFIFHPNLDFPR